MTNIEAGRPDLKLAISPIGWTSDDIPELGGNITFERSIREMALTRFQGTERGRKASIYRLRKNYMWSSLSFWASFLVL